MFDQKAHWEQVLADNFHLLGGGYIELGKPYNEWLYKVRKDKIAEITRRYGIKLDKRTSIIDIGCGAGFWIDYFRNFEVRDIWGIDITEISVKRLSLKYPQYFFLREDIGGENFGVVRKFDIINCFDVLWYLHEEGFRQAFVNFKKISKCGAFLFFTDIFPKTPIVQNEGFRPRTIDEYAKECEKNRLTLINLLPLYYFMNTPCDPTAFKSKKIYGYLNKQWKYVYKFLTVDEKSGFVLGPLFYLLDKSMSKFLKEGPSAKLLVCRNMD